MRGSRTLVVLFVMGSGAIALSPATSALDVGCQRLTDVSTLPAGSSTLFTPPGADALGWTPECVIIENGQTVTFSQRDAIGHGVETGCFRLGRMSVVSTPVTTLKVDRDAETSIVYTEENGELGFCEQLGVVGVGTLTIDYWCEVHGKAMPGKIIVEL